MKAPDNVAPPCTFNSTRIDPNFGALHVIAFKVLHEGVGHTSITEQHHKQIPSREKKKRKKNTTRQHSIV